MKRIFRAGLPPRCEYCEHGKPLDGPDIMCSKHGVVAAEDACRGFKYSALKRVPQRRPRAEASFSEEDFKL